MKHLKNFNQYITERLDYNGINRKMMNLVDYFEKSIEEKEQELPKFFDNNYPNVLENWCSNNPQYFLELDEYESEEEALENVTLPTTHYELAYYPEAEKDYIKYLTDILDNLSSDNNPLDLDFSLLPLYITYTYEDDVVDDWLVHFTENDENLQSILKSQHFLGIPNLDNLAFTTGSEEESVPDGYCFSFHLPDVYYNFKNGYSHYGKSGVIFRSSGVKLYHNGDDELQTIFIGNNVKNLIPFWCDKKTNELYNQDNSIRNKDYEEFFEQMIKMVKI